MGGHRRGRVATGADVPPMDVVQWTNRARTRCRDRCSVRGQSERPGADTLVYDRAPLAPSKLGAGHRRTGRGQRWLEENMACACHGASSVDALWAYGTASGFRQASAWHQRLRIPFRARRWLICGNIGRGGYRCGQPTSVCRLSTGTALARYTVLATVCVVGQFLSCPEDVFGGACRTAPRIQRKDPGQAAELLAVWSVLLCD